MIKNIMYVLGVVFIIIGILGFFNNPILGIFEVDTMHNVVHLASGILALIFASRGENQARTYALVLGIVYALVTVIGFISSTGSILGLFTVNTSDNWLHLVLAIVFLALGLKKPAMGNTMSSSNPSM
jgi:hypothetical protein